MYNVQVHVTYKDSVLDPQGQAVQGAVARLGFEGVDHMRIGKFFEMQVAGSDQAAVTEKVEAICDQLLANPNMEQYRYDIQSMEAE
ncbi:phosphoribosylformylglycinamidine synthase subunit PurS [Latilactobacillus fuchuensis]|uniref:Phosphoribosylformylglycinamidine synthase subunit PurS n=2 Tax=Latilactobacillus fuchuensis TaxID=164393 RepID=A0A2N9DUJ0_9LACO|nr:phosphoribosylformylglycinamidine synthase subunit PurS [Latilactobacillus fuchuensis]KRL61525.1 purS protein [Latilactobacillus fuchuensis DSM 14340 = JCM 11249]MCP8857850.1 phosphoribosylformylglycinamidine synthase subunit PurS [Latilactobacillus fuchuensis]SPC37742.1 factor required for phosphoribosylformylglycinamidine synthetase activity [Latilactobacillus fuchuensis]